MKIGGFSSRTPPSEETISGRVGQLCTEVGGCVNGEEIKKRDRQKRPIRRTVFSVYTVSGKLQSETKV